jgi:hypothetical protein
MRHPLALALCLVLAGSLVHAAPRRNTRHGKVTKKASPVDADTDTDADADADAAPRKLTKKAKRDDDSVDTSVRSSGSHAARKHGKKAKHAAPVDEDDAGADDVVVADDDDAPRPERRKHDRVKPPKRDREASDSDSDRVAFRGDDTEAVADHDDDVVDAPLVREAAEPAHAKKWQVAIGPYLWASSVDANVSLGPASVSSGVDFLEITRHARYGAEILATARCGRFAIYGDGLYGVVGLDAARTVGPLMVTLAGTASSLLVDGNAGYTLVGDPSSVLSLEARGGVRYQRTEIGAAVNVAGAQVAQPRYVNGTADALAGGQVTVRPWRRLALSGTFDVGVFGSSSSTWSATGDASVRATNHVSLSLGYRTLTLESPNVSLTMHGPRAAVQLVF